jgi:TM2 domain-containing membrane protein YozV
MSTTGPMPEDRMPRPAPAPPGWYLDRATGRSRWWDGARWADDFTPEAYPASSNATPYFRPPPPDEKTAGIAGVLTFFFPGAGHLYLGDNQKAVPHLIVNSIGLLLAFTVILLPISALAWAVTLAMTLPTVKRDTDRANALALAEYQRRWGG